MSSLDRALVLAEHLSALTFGSFALVHISSPLAAAFGGERAASEIQVLGRVWYHGPLREALLVWGSLGVHVCAGAAKRITRARRQARRRAEVERAARAAEGDRRPDAGGPEGGRQRWWRGYLPREWHAAVGYLLIPLVFAHSWTHRIAPSKGPDALSPDWVSFQYAARNLALHPAAAALSYGLLAGLATYHAIAGLRVVLSRGRKRPGMAGPGLRGAWAVIMSGVGLGLANLARDSADVPVWLARRYDAFLK